MSIRYCQICRGTAVWTDCSKRYWLCAKHSQAWGVFISSPLNRRGNWQNRWDKLMAEFISVKKSIYGVNKNHSVKRKKKYELL